MSESGIASMKAMGFLFWSAGVMTDLRVFALIGVVAGRTAGAELTPIDRAITRRMPCIDRRWQRCVFGAVRRIEEEWSTEALFVGIDQSAVQHRTIAVV